ncbi:DUF397 domain-containing protein [Streptomyces sp. APSN-46.1]|uniref:DUF397 domain-containing protein n=1 Tax=Streptomyces sp. APSN-46.1 TaxID=2929049 RepID=UPI001FB43A46|nr:DUF397 domain-containing protein [Streptomyces sp. APSN-46.1]MCJ1677894.1 DUF397 domain-containing protein [Streptomyces sp. APSN-46.1]
MLATELGTISWRKSSYSGGGSSGGDCVEVADVQGSVAVRDSKRPEGPAFLVSDVGWGCFMGAVKV